MELTLGLIGFGNAGRAFLRLLEARRRELLARDDLRFRVTAIATGSHGFAVDPTGIDPARALRRVESGKTVSELHAGRPVTDTMDLIRRRPAQVLFELTPLDPRKGMPAVEHIHTALERGMHVITANKGPVAVAYRKLRDLARARGCAFRFEATVMDGTPIFNLMERALPGTRVLGFYGILNSTSNFILTEMENGRSYENSLRRAQAMGIAEADPGFDIDGWDSTVKTAVLANVLMGASLEPARIPRRGIRGIGGEELRRARRERNVLRLVARASRKGRGVTARVGPELLRETEPMAHVLGTSNILALQTDTMKDVVLIETNPGVDQTAYGLFSDLLTLVGDLRLGRLRSRSN